MRPAARSNDITAVSALARFTPGVAAYDPPFRAYANGDLRRFQGSALFPNVAVRMTGIDRRKSN